MLVAIEGCAHGDLVSIYNAIQETEAANGVKVDLLICCGDFQVTPNQHTTSVTLLVVRWLSAEL